MATLKNIYRISSKVSAVINAIMRWIVAFLVFGCFVTVFLQVINRYILVKQTLFHWQSITWSDELARLFLVCLTYASLGMCYKYGHMARIDIVFSRLGHRGKYILYIIETIMMMIFICYVCYYGIMFARVNVIYRSHILKISGIYLYSIPVVGCILTGFEIITDFFGVISGERLPFASEEPLKSAE